MPFIEKSQSSGKAITTVKNPFAFRDKFLSRRKTFEIVVYLLVFLLATLFILPKNNSPQLSMGGRSTHLLIRENVTFYVFSVCDTEVVFTSQR